MSAAPLDHVDGVPWLFEAQRVFLYCNGLGSYRSDSEHDPPMECLLYCSVKFTPLVFRGAQNWETYVYPSSIQLTRYSWFNDILASWPATNYGALHVPIQQQRQRFTEFCVYPTLMVIYFGSWPINTGGDKTRLGIGGDLCTYFRNNTNGRVSLIILIW